MIEDVFQGGILTGAVKVAMVYRIGVYFIIPSHCSLKESCHVLQPFILVMILATSGRVGRVLGDPIAPYRDPYLDVTDIRSEMRISHKPICTFGQSFGGTLHLD